MSAFDWNQMRAFLATVETGSLSAAARATGLTQPTLSRQVAALGGGKLGPEQGDQAAAGRLGDTDQFQQSGLARAR